MSVRTWFAVVAAVFAWSSAAFAAPQPTAARYPVVPLAQVQALTLPTLDRVAIEREDAADTLAGLPPRFALARKANISPNRDGTWETLDAKTKLWRYHVIGSDATSLNLAFTQLRLPTGASLLLYTPDMKIVRAATTKPGRSEWWSPVVPASELVVELTIPSASVPKLALEIGQIGQGYRGFGATGSSAGACNMDVECLLAADPWRDNARAVAMYTLNGIRQCSGSLINDTDGDRKLYFITAHHCQVSAANAASMVVYWNFENSLCRLPGSVASGSPGDGTLDQSSSGATLRADYAASDVTLVELDDAPPAAFNLFWEGWDRTPYVLPGGPGNGDFACSAGTLCAAIHHPNTDEKRITFSAADTTTTSYLDPTSPGDGTHTLAAWNPAPIFPPDPQQTIPPQVTEPGSSGSPLYNAERRFIGQLHGGPSTCGATGTDLSDYYGRLAVSWEGGGTAATRLKDWLDAGNSGAMTTDGINRCTAPAIPTNVVATANGANEIDVAWDTIAGADTYNVYRGDGACPGTNWHLLASGVATASYVDSTVSGGSAYAYAVTSVASAESCESTFSACSGATATGTCTMPPTFSGLISAQSSHTDICGVDLAWSAATPNCGASVTYSVYRSTTPAFTPSAANRIASCEPTTAYHDDDASGGSTYYYAVHAEDDTTNGVGACNAGNEDTNLVEHAATPTGADTTSFADDLEGGIANWSVDGTGAGADFALATDLAHSPTQAWFASDPAAIGDHRVALTAAVAIPANAVLEFWHHYDVERGTGSFDGIVVEYSLDGSTWTDILAANPPIAANANRFLQNGYTDTINTVHGNPLAGRLAWSGANVGFGLVRVDLADFAGQSVRFRWRVGTDDSVSAPGYWLDDVRVLAPGMCMLDSIFVDGFDVGP